MRSMSRKAAIVGIGTSGFSRDFGKTELRMICESVRMALDDAGLVPEDIDGMIKHSDEAPDERAIGDSMGMGNLTYFGDCRWDGAACGMVLRAAIGVTSGMANYVVVLRAFNESSGRRTKTSMRDIDQLCTSDLLQWGFHVPYGHMTEAGRVAMIVRRYMHECGVKGNDFGWVTTVCREHGARNPEGVFHGQPISIEAYLKSEMVVDPLRKLDCYEATDAAVALVITTAEKARRLKQRPAYILSAARTMVNGTEEKNGLYGPEPGALTETRRMGERLFEMAGVKPREIRVAQLDDAYAPLVPMQLEALGFCGKGEGAAFCSGGDRIRVGGQLPINTSGGSLGEGYLRSMNHVVEAVRQIRGTSTAQSEDAHLVLVSAGAGGPSSGLILGR